MNRETIPPIKVGDILKLAIKKLGKEGDPVMIHEGFVIFLKNGVDRSFQLNAMIEVKITKVLPKFAFAEKT